MPPPTVSRCLRCLCCLLGLVVGRGRLEPLACCSVRPLLCREGSPDASDPALPRFSPFGPLPTSCFWKRRRNACAASFK